MYMTNRFFSQKSIETAHEIVWVTNALNLSQFQSKNAKTLIFE